jgi:hypothetical protein
VYVLVGKLTHEKYILSCSLELVPARGYDFPHPCDGLGTVTSNGPREAMGLTCPLYIKKCQRGVQFACFMTSVTGKTLTPYARFTNDLNYSADKAVLIYEVHTSNPDVQNTKVICIRRGKT